MESVLNSPVRLGRRRGRPSKLRSLLESDPDAYERMLDRIRSGAFAWVAAQSLGIAAETFSRWLARGAKQQKGIFRQFRQDVEKAQAHARALAEIEVHQKNPLAWLRYGPGRSKPGVPGWTEYRDSNAEAPPASFRAPAEPPTVPRADPNPMATALLTFEELGLATLTPIGREMAKVGTSGQSEDYANIADAAPY
jgi:hypothetical protein